MTTVQGLQIVGALAVCDFAWGFLTFILLVRRNRKGSGFSPLPPMLFPAYWIPCFKPKSSLVFHQEGYGVLRILESSVTFLCLAALSIAVAGVVPGWLSMRVTAGDADENGQNEAES